MMIYKAFLGYPDWYSWLHDWLPIIFMGMIVIGIFALMRFMPRTRPEQIKPDAAPPIGWNDIAGSDEAKEELREVVDYLRDPKRFREIGAKVPKGILLHGPPGTGKTLLAKAVAHESGATFFSQSAASFVEMFVGVGAARIRRLFKAARKKAPAIVFIDELEAVGSQRGHDVTGERDQTLNQLLVEMDGFVARKDVVVIAASNMLEKLDHALLRPGRFDRQIFVSPPDVGGREKILSVHSRNKPLADDVDLKLIARQTAGLTGADLANICNEAAIFAARRGATQVLMADFDSSLERVVAGMQSRRALSDHEKRVVAYHEAGHALCGELLPSVDRVHRISIVPRGRALGYTLNLPEEDRYLKTREELIDYMTMLLGGRATEQIVFGSITTGAADDLRRVADIANSMIHEYAMGTGITSLRMAGDGTSEATRRARDEEVRELADEAFRAARTIIDTHRPQLDELATTLLSNEVLERADIDRIIGDVPRAAPPRMGKGLGIAAATAVSPAPRPGPRV
jgi:cell division protease FtsH